MIKIAEYTISRNKLSGYAILVGILIGLFNAIFLPIDFTLRPELFGWLMASLISTVVFHESVHGISAVLFGHSLFLE